MSLANDVNRLHNETGCGLLECRKAIEYAKSHDGCTPLGYLKAKGIAVATPRYTFEERVRWFSTERRTDDE